MIETLPPALRAWPSLQRTELQQYATGDVFPQPLPPKLRELLSELAHEVRSSSWKTKQELAAAEALAEDLKKGPLQTIKDKQWSLMRFVSRRRSSVDQTEVDVLHKASKDAADTSIMTHEPTVAEDNGTPVAKNDVVSETKADTPVAAPVALPVAVDAEAPSKLFSAPQTTEERDVIAPPAATPSPAASTLTKDVAAASFSMPGKDTATRQASEEDSSSFDAATMLKTTLQGIMATANKVAGYTATATPPVDKEPATQIKTTLGKVIALAEGFADDMRKSCAGLVDTNSVARLDGPIANAKAVMNDLETGTSKLGEAETTACMLLGVCLESMSEMAENARKAADELQSKKTRFRAIVQDLHQALRNLCDIASALRPMADMDGFGTRDSNTESADTTKSTGDAEKSILDGQARSMDPGSDDGPVPVAVAEQAAGESSPEDEIKDDVQDNTNDVAPRQAEETANEAEANALAHEPNAETPAPNDDSPEAVAKEAERSKAATKETEPAEAVPIEPTEAATEVDRAEPANESTAEVIVPVEEAPAKPTTEEAPNVVAVEDAPEGPSEGGVEVTTTDGMEEATAETAAEATAEATVEATDAATADAPVDDAPVEEGPVDLPTAETTHAATAEVIGAATAEVTDSAAEDAPVEDAPAEDAPAEDAPAEDAPAEDAPVEGAPTEAAPTDEASAEEAGAEDTGDAGDTTTAETQDAAAEIQDTPDATTSAEAAETEAAEPTTATETGVETVTTEDAQTTEATEAADPDAQVAPEATDTVEDGTNPVADEATAPVPEAEVNPGDTVTEAPEVTKGTETAQDTTVTEDVAIPTVVESDEPPAPCPPSPDLETVDNASKVPSGEEEVAEPDTPAVDAAATESDSPAAELDAGTAEPDAPAAEPDAPVADAKAPDGDTPAAEPAPEAETEGKPAE